MSAFLEDTEEQPIEERTTNTLWCEKYRPTKLADYIGNADLKIKVAKWIATNDIPHLLFYGGPGTGKTTLAKLITKSIKCDVLYVNASSENKIDDVRIKVTNFASTLGFSKLKVVILDECLDENTLVWILRNGKEISVPIKHVDDKLDLVKSWNVKLEKIEWMPFYLWDKGEQDVYQIELENGEMVTCTEDHKWYVEDDGTKVVKTKDLHRYNHILSP